MCGHYIWKDFSHVNQGREMQWGEVRKRWDFVYVLYISNPSTFLHPHRHCPILSHHDLWCWKHNGLLTGSPFVTSATCKKVGTQGIAVEMLASGVHYCNGVSKAARDTAPQVKKEPCEKIGRVQSPFLIKKLKLKQYEWIYICMCAKSLQSCPTLWDPVDCSPPGSSVHGISQARILEWVASSFSRRSSWPRDWTHISYLSWTGRQVLYR